MKTALKYQLWEVKRPLIIYYMVIYSIYICLALLISTVASLSNSLHGLSGMWFASAIFIFIIGLNSFKETFRMFGQNSQTRRILFLSFFACLVIVAALMSLLDHINIAVMHPVTEDMPVTIGQYKRILSADGTLRYTANGINTWFDSIVWCFSLYLMMGMIGHFITVSYYRMNKSLKIIVSVGASLFLSTVPSLIEMIDRTYLHSVLSIAIYEFWEFLFSDPYYTITAFILVTAVAGMLSWLMIRKAVVKE